MTPRQPTTAQDGQNSPQTVDSMPGAELDLVAIETVQYELLRNPMYNWNEIQVIETIDDLLAEVKRVRSELAQLEISWRSTWEKQDGQGFKCACCNQWQPDGVGHRCEGKEGE